MHNTLILAWTFHCFCPALLILCSSKCIFQTDFIKYGFLLKCKHVKAENVTEFSYTIDKSISLTHTHLTLLYYTHPRHTTLPYQYPHTPIPHKHTYTFPLSHPSHTHIWHTHTTPIHTHPTPLTAFYNHLGILIFHQYLVLNILFLF